MKYVSAKVFAKEQGFSVRWIQELCRRGKINGATRLAGNGTWMIPLEATISNDITINIQQNGTINMITEESNMVNAEKQMETGQMLLNEANFDMAAVYFEFAGEEFVRREDYKSALLAYEKTLYCFTTDGNSSRVKTIESIVASIKLKLEAK